MEKIVCKNCGAPLGKSDSFCTNCGVRVEFTIDGPIQSQVSQETAPEPVAEEVVQETKQEAVKEKKEKKKKEKTEKAVSQKMVYKPKRGKAGLIVAILLLVLVVAAGVTVFIFKDKLFGTKKVTVPTLDYAYLTTDDKPVIDYECEKVIYPALYNTLNSVVSFTAYTIEEPCEVSVKVEMPDFAQTYEKVVSLSDKITHLDIKPVLANNLELSSQKEVQLAITVTDNKSGTVYLQDSVAVTIMSKNDFVLFANGDATSDKTYDAVAWVTPEASDIVKLNRIAVEYLQEWEESYSDVYVSSMVGYQWVESYGIDTVWHQLMAIQYAISECGIRYNSASFSTSVGENYHQRVMFPSEVIDNLSGICIETAFLYASAAQAAGFDCFIAFSQSHCRVFVKAATSGTYENYYYEVETTYLPVSDAKDATKAVTLFSPQMMKKVIDEEELTLISCNLGKYIGITSLYNE